MITRIMGMSVVGPASYAIHQLRQQAVRHLPRVMPVVRNQPFSTDRDKVIRLNLQIPFRTNDGTTIKETHHTVLSALRQGGNIDSLMSLRYLSLSEPEEQTILGDANRAGSELDKQNSAWTLYSLTKYADDAFLRKPEALDTLVELYRGLDSEAARTQIAKAIVNITSHQPDQVGAFCTPEVRDILVDYVKTGTLSQRECKKITDSFLHITASHPQGSLFGTSAVLEAVKSLALRVKEGVKREDIRILGWEGTSSSAANNIASFMAQSLRLNPDSQAWLSTSEVRDILLDFGHHSASALNGVHTSKILTAIQEIVKNNPAGKERFSTPEVRDLLIKLGTLSQSDNSLRGVRINDRSHHVEETIKAIIDGYPTGETLFDTPEMRTLRSNIQHDLDSARNYPGF